MELLLIYLWLKINWLIGLCIVGVISTLMTSLIFCVNAGDAYTGSVEETLGYKRSKKFLIAAIGFLIGATAIPSQTDTAILVGSSFAIDAVKSPEGQKIQTLLRKKANELLDEQLKDKKP